MVIRVSARIWAVFVPSLGSDREAEHDYDDQTSDERDEPEQEVGGGSVLIVESFCAQCELAPDGDREPQVCAEDPYVHDRVVSSVVAARFVVRCEP